MDKLDAITFDELLKDQDPFGSGTGRINLQGIRLITPAGLTQLAAACQTMQRSGLRTRLLVDDAAVRSYLVRSGFAHAVEGIAEIEPPVDLRNGFLFEVQRGGSPMLIEVTRIDSGAALPALLNKIVWVLRYKLKYRKNDAFDVATAVSEICQNTFDHNTGTIGFLAMQVYGKGIGRFLEISVSDHGSGLASTLQRNPKNGRMASDMAAIKLATTLGSSEHDDLTRGTGLFHLLEITYKHEGAIQIRSGDAKVRYRMDKRQGWGFAVPHAPGVQIAMNLPTKARA